MNALLFERREREQLRTTSTRVPSSALGDAEDRVARARDALTLFDPDEPDVDAVYDLAARASVGPLDLPAEIERFGADERGGVGISIPHAPPTTKAT